MKFKSIIAALAITTFTAQAFAEDKYDECETDYALAEAIMDARQSGVSIVNALKPAPDDYIREVVRQAYETPRFSSEEFQRRAVSDYAEMAYKVCVEVVSRNKNNR